MSSRRTRRRRTQGSDAGSDSSDGGSRMQSKGGRKKKGKRKKKKKKKKNKEKPEISPWATEDGAASGLVSLAEMASSETAEKPISDPWSGTRSAAGTLASSLDEYVLLTGGVEIPPSLKIQQPALVLQKLAKGTCWHLPSKLLAISGDLDFEGMLPAETLQNALITAGAIKARADGGLSLVADEAATIIQYALRIWVARVALRKLREERQFEEEERKFWAAETDSGPPKMKLEQEQRQGQEQSQQEKAEQQRRDEKIIVEACVEDMCSRVLWESVPNIAKEIIKRVLEKVAAKTMTDIERRSAKATLDTIVASQDTMTSRENTKKQEREEEEGKGQAEREAPLVLRICIRKCKMRGLALCKCVLAGCTSLDLSHNMISTSSIELMRKNWLRELVLSDNCISQIPDIAESMPKLVRLDLSFNRKLCDIASLKSRHRLRALTTLCDLNLEGCSITHLGDDIDDLRLRDKERVCMALEDLNILDLPEPFMQDLRESTYLASRQDAMSELQNLSGEVERKRAELEILYAAKFREMKLNKEQKKEVKKEFDDEKKKRLAVVQSDVSRRMNMLEKQLQKAEIDHAKIKEEEEATIQAALAHAKELAAGVEPTPLYSPFFALQENLRKLNLADNMVQDTGQLELLTCLPHLERLSIRWNPCSELDGEYDARRQRLCDALLSNANTLRYVDQEKIVRGFPLRKAQPKVVWEKLRQGQQRGARGIRVTDHGEVTECTCCRGVVCVVPYTCSDWSNRHNLVKAALTNMVTKFAVHRLRGRDYVLSKTAFPDQEDRY
eukprot:g3508.t1